MSTSCETNSGAGLAPAGILSRIGKLTLGALQLFFVVNLLRVFQIGFPEEVVRSTGFWIGVVLAFALLSWTVNLGFNRPWGARPFVAALIIAGAAGLYSAAIMGSLWSPPLLVVLWGLTIYVHGHMGICHVLAAVMGTPGCEMRVFTHIKSKLRGGQATLCACPGFWTPLDGWEENLKRKLRGEDTLAFNR